MLTPVFVGGATVAANLALACVSCSLRKGARQVATDPMTEEEVSLYHPRHDIWQDHFDWEAVTVIGKTPTARATILALDMNRPLILAIRREEVLLGRHTPPERIRRDL